MPAGKILQQQTVFCGNYLNDEKLRTMKYAQIEEAMNNQFGDSLANMNVKPNATIRFTIVFRNLPQESGEHQCRGGRLQARRTLGENGHCGLPGSCETAKRRTFRCGVSHVSDCLGCSSRR